MPVTPLEDTYGATLEDVKALLPHLELGSEASPEGAESQPSETDVVRFLRWAASWVRQRAGVIVEEDPDNPGEESPAWAMARSVTVLGGAAWTEAGGFPERADLSESTYAGMLWSQFKDGLDELLESLGLGTSSSGGAATAVPSGLPAAAFPARPIFRRDQGF